MSDYQPEFSFALHVCLEFKALFTRVHVIGSDGQISKYQFEVPSQVFSRVNVVGSDGQISDYQPEFPFALPVSQRDWFRRSD